MLDPHMTRRCMNEPSRGKVMSNEPYEWEFRGKNLRLL